MGYAVRKDGQGWRAVSGLKDVGSDEVFSENQPPLPTQNPQIAISGRLAQLRTTRENILNRLTGIAARAERKGDAATASACDIAAQSLLDITKNLPTDMEAISAEVLTRYKSIVATASAAAPGLVGAFVGVDL